MWQRTRRAPGHNAMYDVRAPVHDYVADDTASSGTVGPRLLAAVGVQRLVPRYAARHQLVVPPHRLETALYNDYAERLRDETHACSGWEEDGFGIRQRKC